MKKNIKNLLKILKDQKKFN